MRRLLLLALLIAPALWAQQTQVASDTLQHAACASSCGSGGQLGANWKQNSGNNLLESASGVTQGFTGNGYDYRDQAYWAGTGSFGNDMYSQVSCANIGIENTSRACGVSVRMSGTLAGQSTTSGYMCYLTSDGNFAGTADALLYKTTGGTNTQIGTTQTGLTIANPVVLNLQVVGSSLVCKVGSTTVFTQTDSTITTGGVPGVLVGNGVSSPLLTTWTGGTASSQPTVANPTSSLGTGTYAMPQTPTLNVSTSGATICETTDGSNPTTPGTPDGTCTNGTAKSDGNTITISATTTLKLLGTKTGDINSSIVTYTYTQAQVANPTATDGTGTYNNDPVSETLSDATGSSVICYRTDGTNPAATTPGTCDGGSTTYSGAFNVSPSGGTATVKALGTESGYLNSSVVTFTYTFTVSAVADSPGAGTYTSPQTATLSIATTTGATILYTLTGSTPSCPSTGTTYSGGIPINSTTTVKAIGCKTNYNSSSVQSDTYTINVCGPVTYSPVAGGYFTSQTVSLSASVCSSPTICYTTDGSTPTESANSCTHGSTYSSGFAVSSSETVKALATKSGYGDSSITSAAYAINPPDQTGSYQFSDNFSNYHLLVAADGKQQPLDAWNTSGLWTINGSPSIAQSTATYFNTIRGGSTVMLYNGSPQYTWATYTGATGFTGAGQGQYSSGTVEGGSAAAYDWYAGLSYLSGASTDPLTYNVGGFYYQASANCTSGSIEPNPWNQTVGGTSNDNGGSGGCTWTNIGTLLSGPRPSPCVFTFSDTSNGLTGYSLCLNSSGTALLSKNTSTGSIATSSVGACAQAGSTPVTLELRTLNGVNQPLCGGSTPAGMSATYTDGSPLTTGNPGVAGTGLYNWVGGTINASSPPTPISWPGNTYPSYTGFAWTTSGDSSYGTWPFYQASGAFSELQTHTPNAVNTNATFNGTTATISSTLNPGTSATVLISGSQGAGFNGTVTTLSSSSSQYTFSSAFTPNSIYTMSETGSTISLAWSGGNQLKPSINGTIVINGAVPSGYNGTCTVITTSAGSATCSNGNSGLGTVTTLGTVVMPGQSTLLSSTYALGTDNTLGVTQNQYMAPFTPAQWILGTVAIDTTDTTVQNYFFKLQGNSAILGGAGCYDLNGYYVGEEPEWPSYGGSSPYPNACTGTLEYCGTLFLHITKDTPTTSVDPGGGCAAHPNYNVVTVSGSAYIAMAGDQILSMYTANGYLDVYCKGTAHSAAAPFGDGCPSTTHFYRVIHVQDTDMLTPTSSGNSQGFPGVWSGGSAPQLSVFQNISMGSSGSCASITGASCIAPTQFVNVSMVP